MLDASMRYPWPGNVRELENACERIAQTCICDQVIAGCVPAAILFHKSLAPATAAQGPGEGAAGREAPLPEGGAVSLYDRLDSLEASMITWALRAASGNQSKAATLLKVKRSTLGDRIRKLNLSHLESARADSSREEAG
jgi:DNA-binding NtrC family response regulator